MNSELEHLSFEDSVTLLLNQNALKGGKYPFLQGMDLVVNNEDYEVPYGLPFLVYEEDEEIKIKFFEALDI
jgi:hypothetical protein